MVPFVSLPIHTHTHTQLSIIGPQCCGSITELIMEKAVEFYFQNCARTEKSNSNSHPMITIALHYGILKNMCLTSHRQQGSASDIISLHVSVLLHPNVDRENWTLFYKLV